MITLTSKIPNMFLFRSRIRQECLFSSILLPIALEILISKIKKEKEIKCIRIRKKEVKLPLFIVDMIIYIYIENL
mgnify:CR=1 FL=1